MTGPFYERDSCQEIKTSHNCWLVGSEIRGVDFAQLEGRTFIKNKT